MTFFDVKNYLHILLKAFSSSLAPFLLKCVMQLSVEAEPDLKKKIYISAKSFEKKNPTLHLTNITGGQQLCVGFGEKV